MRSYAVVVCGRLLGHLVPGLPAAPPDSPSIKMLEDAMRRQQEEISPAAPVAAAAGGRPCAGEAGRARGSEGEQHREGPPRVPRDVRRDSVHPLARPEDPAREGRARASASRRSDAREASAAGGKGTAAGAAPRPRVRDLTPGP